jgi:hypothetical protein
MFVNLGNLGAVIMAPFFQTNGPEDTTAYAEHIQKHLGLLEIGSKGVVPDDLYAAAREAATIADPVAWAAKIAEIAPGP